MEPNQHFKVQVQSRLMSQSPGTMRQVIAPKAAAVHAIGQATLLQPAAFAVAFSSVSSIAGELLCL